MLRHDSRDRSAGHVSDVEDAARHPAAVDASEARNDASKHSEVVPSLEELQDVATDRTELMLSLQHAVL